MNDTPDSGPAPTHSAIRIEESGQFVTISLSPRPLGLLWLVFGFNCFALLLFFVLGALYLLFRIPLFNGVPIQPPSIHAAAGIRWYIEFTIIWLAGMTLLAGGLGFIWLPLMTREVLAFGPGGLTVVKERPLHREQFSSDWLNVAEIALERDPMGVRQSRLVISLLSGKQCLLAEQLGEADRERLAVLCNACAERFGRA
jgi:hypothetical protein